MAEVITKSKFSFKSTQKSLLKFLSYGNKVVIKTPNKVVLIKEHWMREKNV